MKKKKKKNILMGFPNDSGFVIFQVVAEVSFDLLLNIISPTPRAYAQTLFLANNNGTRLMEIRYVEI
jgi:hypothetical protein